MTVERRCYLSSLSAEGTGAAWRFAEAVRRPWGIENQVLRRLDLSLREDENRVRKDHAPQNLATLRHLSLNLLRREPTTKRGSGASD